MSLIKSISGIRGTIGGEPGNNLTPLDIVKFAAAYGKWLKEKHSGKKVVIGRDARISGTMVSQLVVNTLLAMGFDVIDAGLSTTPTVEMAVVWEQADGGIIITASHNPKQWNALKLLNSNGEFISAEDGAWILQQAEANDYIFETVQNLGKFSVKNSFIEEHINAVLNYPLVNAEAIAKKKFTVVVDTVNSTGALSVPLLLQRLGITNIIVINEAITGDFAHNPEPLPEHLTQLSSAVIQHNADLGIAVDPDVDRLCFVNEDGTMFGEEYTLVAVADYMLSKQKGNTVSNLSSTSALRDVTLRCGGAYYPSAVGEVNVVNKMKEVKAIIGGEGNGGVIVPDFHYGRDALIGIGLFLSALAEQPEKISIFRNKYPHYVMHKSKIELTADMDIKKMLKDIPENFKNQSINTIDGLRIDFINGWVHLRTSNTEPIMRIYAESVNKEEAEGLVDGIKKIINKL